MMMKITYILGLMFIGFCAFGQVGIGTTSPQQELHIAGPNSTIRFETFNTINSPLYNDGIKLAPTFVDGRGEIKLGDGLNSNTALPLNFLLENFNFIPDDPYGIGVNTGNVVNNILGESYKEGLFRTIPITVPLDVLVEVKYGVTMMVKGSNLAIGPPYVNVTYDEAIKIGLFFCIDIDSDGLDASEFAKRYGYNGQYYETQFGGIDGHSYINSQGYLTLPKGSHTIHFYGIIEDQTTSYTSVGYGGGKDYLKVRVYN